MTNRTARERIASFEAEARLTGCLGVDDVELIAAVARRALDALEVLSGWDCDATDAQKALADIDELARSGR